MKTKVKFYMEPDEKTGCASVLAVFPDERRPDYGPTGESVELIACYSHLGQHSECCPEYLEGLKKASPEQYGDLKKELESIGYDLETEN